MLRNSGVLSPTLEPCKYNFFSALFSFFIPTLWLCFWFVWFFWWFFSPHVLLQPLMSEALPTWQILANLEFWLPCLFHIHFCLCHDTSFPIKTQFFFLKLQTCSVCPSFPFYSLYGIWCLCGQSYFCISFCLSGSNLALPLPSCRIQYLLALVLSFSKVVLFQVCFQIGSSPLLLFLNLAGGIQSQHKKHDALT